MEQSWLDPDFATEQIVTLALLFLGSLIVLPVVFGAVIYSVLSLFARLTDRHRSPEDSPEADEEP